jgi:para-aminobenzoate synthetase component 1
MAESTTVTIANIESFKIKAINWANRFDTFCLLDSNKYFYDGYSTKSWILGIGALDSVTAGIHAFERLKTFQEKAGSIIFGFFGYDLKNQIEALESSHADNLGFPELYFFKPRYVIEINDNKVTINRNYPETFELIELINKEEEEPVYSANKTAIKLKSRTTRAKYLQNVINIKKQIEDGDFYELNYCNEFFAENVQIDPIGIFNRLNEKAAAPFSSLFKLNHSYLLCTSPERFLKKIGSKLISQPIKGTIKKGVNAHENELLKTKLANDIKERAENVMIVDLVRNDLSRSAVPGTVIVEELFGIYEFNTVNQMISTVTSQLKSDVHFMDALKFAFPMGSMTGAPKIEVMKNIERYENFRRGLYSGSAGYIEPNGNFDFNVVIRSILYNAKTGYLSVPAGGAITYDSIPEEEYEEILLKARNMIEAVGAALED